MSARASEDDDRRTAICNVAVAHLSLFRRAHGSVLDPSERARAARFRQEADRVRFVLGSVLARAAAGAEVAEPPQAIVLNRSCPDCGEPHGKPQIIGHDLEISIAHSGDLVAVACSRAGAVGIDVESRAATRGVDHRDLGRSVCSTFELQDVIDWPTFLTYWTRKEAILKATGHGLRLPMTEVVVSAPHEPPTLLAFPAATVPICQLATLDVGPNHIGAVAVLTAAALTVNVSDAASLLLDEELWGRS